MRVMSWGKGALRQQTHLFQKLNDSLAELTLIGKNTDLLQIFGMEMTLRSHWLNGPFLHWLEPLLAESKKSDVPKSAANSPALWNSCMARNHDKEQIFFFWNQIHVHSDSVGFLISNSEPMALARFRLRKRNLTCYQRGKYSLSKTDNTAGVQGQCLAATDNLLKFSHLHQDAGSTWNRAPSETISTILNWTFPDFCTVFRWMML
jgi:hypothetical protein